MTDIKLRFFTNISHELRTPLTLIVAPVENILQNERISQSVRNQLEIVQSNSQRMLRMVNQLLEFRKVQNQKMKLKIQQTLLSDLVEETCANFSKEADDKHIRFEVINQAEDSTVWVDRGRMDTILWNLLSNAFKFTPAGKSIRVIIADKPGFVTLAVQDEGVGIPLDKRNVLFERFSSNNELNSNNMICTTATLTWRAKWAKARRSPFFCIPAKSISAPRWSSSPMTTPLSRPSNRHSRIRWSNSSRSSRSSNAQSS